MSDPQSYVIIYGLTGGQQNDQSTGKPSVKKLLLAVCWIHTLVLDLIKLLKDIYYQINKNILFG